MRRVVTAAFVLGAILATTLAVRGSSSVPPLGPQRIALGVNLEGQPGDPARLDAHQAVVGRHPAIVMWFQQWSEPFVYGGELDAVRRRGAVPMITWEPSLSGKGIPLQEIAAGVHDDLILRAAATARRYSDLLYVRFAHEMNLRTSPWGADSNGNSPAAFVGAWRRVVRLFRRAGAGNVEWVWSPNVDTGTSTPLARLFPGDDFVDAVGLDGYNFGSLDPSGFRSLSKVFGESYDELTRLSRRPVFIAETASTELGGDKGRWIREGLMRDVPRRLPRVRALIWFDRAKETDWRIASSPDSAAAFRAVARSQLYSGTATPTRPAFANPERPVALTATTVRLRGQQLGLSLRCQSKSSCVIRVRLSSKARPEVTLGEGGGTVPSGRARTVSVSVDAATRRVIASRGSVQLVVSLQLLGGKTLARTVTVLPAR